MQPHGHDCPPCDCGHDVEHCKHAHLPWSQLADHEKAILDFEAQAWTYPGAKETAIVEQFGVLAPTYYLKLNALIGRPEALAYAPLLVKRLLRLRDARRDARSRGAAWGNSWGSQSPYGHR